MLDKSQYESFIKSINEIKKNISDKKSEYHKLADDILDRCFLPLKTMLNKVDEKQSFSRTTFESHERITPLMEKLKKQKIIVDTLNGKVRALEEEKKKLQQLEDCVELLKPRDQEEKNNIENTCVTLRLILEQTARDYFNWCRSGWVNNNLSENSCKDFNEKFKGIATAETTTDGGHFEMDDLSELTLEELSKRVLFLVGDGKKNANRRYYLVEAIRKHDLNGAIFEISSVSARTPAIHERLLSSEKCSTLEMAELTVDLKKIQLNVSNIFNNDIKKEAGEEIDGVATSQLLAQSQIDLAKSDLNKQVNINSKNMEGIILEMSKLNMLTAEEKHPISAVCEQWKQDIREAKDCNVLKSIQKKLDDQIEKTERECAHKIDCFLLEKRDITQQASQVLSTEPYHHYWQRLGEQRNTIIKQAVADLNQVKDVLAQRNMALQNKYAGLSPLYSLFKEGFFKRNDHIETWHRQLRGFRGGKVEMESLEGAPDIRVPEGIALIIRKMKEYKPDQQDDSSDLKKLVKEISDIAKNRLNSKFSSLFRTKMTHEFYESVSCLNSENNDSIQQVQSQLTTMRNKFFPK